MPRKPAVKVEVKGPDLAPLRAAQIVPLDCDCEGCRALVLAYGSDEQLHLTYRIKLLKRGWAGKVTPEEKKFQQAHLGWATRPTPESGPFARKLASESGSTPEVAVEDSSGLPEAV